MFHVLPDALARDRRGLCPTCGSPLDIAPDDENSRCELCGGESALEYRVREIEAETGLPGDVTAWADPRQCPPACPRCEAGLTRSPESTALACGACGTQGRLEARLNAIAPDEMPEPQERTRADFENQARDRIDYPFDIQTEQLFWRLLTEPDLSQRVALGQKFQSWSYANRTAVRFLPALLTRLMKDHDAVAATAGDVIGKLLCQENSSLWPGVLEACGRVMFDTTAKRSLLDEVCLGKSVCVKLLIDVADFAEREGDEEYAALALSSVGTLIGRNFDDHPIIGAIVLYRLFDVTGVVLGWALDALAHSYLRTKVPPEMMIPVIDELGEERPQIVPHVIECLFAPAAETAEDYRLRLGLISDCRGWAGRAAGLEILGVPPEGHSELWAEAVAAIDASLEHPVGGWSAEKALYALVRDMGGDRTGALDELVERRGETLSYRVKREYIRRRPDTDLLSTSEPYYWQSDEDRPVDAETAGHIERYKSCLRSALERDVDAEEILRLKNEARRLDVPVFLRDGPPTIPVPDDRNPELIEAKREAERSRVNDAVEAIQSEYNSRIGELSAEMMKSMNDQAEVQRISAEMMRLGEQLQKDLEATWGE